MSFATEPSLAALWTIATRVPAGPRWCVLGDASLRLSGARGVTVANLEIQTDNYGLEWLHAILPIERKRPGFRADLNATVVYGTIDDIPLEIYGHHPLADTHIFPHTKVVDFKGVPVPTVPPERLFFLYKAMGREELLLYVARHVALPLRDG